MKELVSKISNGVKKYQADIILVIGVILISLLSFAAGFIVAKQQEKEPLRIEFYESSHHWSGNLRIISGLEIS
jgi:hypothetical protein